MRPFLAIIVASLGGFQMLFSAPERVWNELPPLPEGRSGMVSFVTSQSEPAFYGGSSWSENGKQIHATGYVFRENEWQPLDSLKGPIAYAAVAPKKTQLWATGGTDGIGVLPKALKLSSNRLIREFPIIPSQARIYAGAAFVDNAFYQLGGSTELSPLAPSTTISKYEQGSWLDVGQLPEGSLINPAVATWKNRILIFGGGIPSAEGLKNTDSIFSFEPVERAWTKQTDLPAPTRGTVSLTLPEIGILLVGGYRDSTDFTPQVLLFDPVENRALSLAPLPLGLMLPAVVATENRVFVFGGEDAPRHRSRMVYQAKLSTLLESSSN